MRGVREGNLDGLRKRISTLFLQYIKTPTFNPEAAKLLKVHTKSPDKTFTVQFGFPKSKYYSMIIKLLIFFIIPPKINHKKRIILHLVCAFPPQVPQDPSALRKNIYFCPSCNQYLPSTEFALSSNSRTVGKCHKCTKIDNDARTRQDYSTYTYMLKMLRRSEERHGDGSRIAFLLQVRLRNICIHFDDYKVSFFGMKNFVNLVCTSLVLKIFFLKIYNLDHILLKSNRMFNKLVFSYTLNK